MIHVCYALYDGNGKYAKYIGTSMVSIFENTNSEITIHILHDSTLTRDNRKKLTKIAYQYDQEIEFYNMDSLAKDGIDEINRQIPDINRRFRPSIAMFYRVFIPDFLPRDIHRAIYLDADIIVNLDIAELWQIDLEGKLIAARPDANIIANPNEKLTLPTQVIDALKKEMARRYVIIRDGTVTCEDYFNSGVLIFDLDKMRATFNKNGQLLRECLQVLQKYRGEITFLDQDALNVIFNKQYFKLSGKFNWDLCHTGRWKKPMKIEPWIYHFNGAIIRLDSKLPHNRMWLKYYMKTPFCTPESIGNLFSWMANRIDSANQEITRLNDWIKDVVPVMLSRRKIYFTDLKTWEDISHSFARSGDILINASMPNSTEILIRELQPNRSPDSQDKRIAMIHISDSKIYDELQKTLIDAGFVLNVDFVNLIDKFQNRSEPIKYDTQEMINNM